MGSEWFEPESLTIEIGESVLWYNTNGRRHTVTAYQERIPEHAEYFASGGFDSESEARFRFSGGRGDQHSPGGGLQEGGAYAQVLDVPGTYEYFCIPHEDQGMTGTIVVEEE